MMLASLPLFKNHLFVCGCALFLAGLHQKEEEPWLFYLQISIIYLGAALSKVFDPDWLSGHFMHHWMNAETANPIYLTITSFWKGNGLALFLSYYTTILLELILIPLFLFRRTRDSAVLISVLFHILLFLFTGLRFGFFIEALFIFMLIFLEWPKFKWQVSGTGLIIQIIKKLDWNRRLSILNAQPNGSWLELREKEVLLSTNWIALANILKYSVGFYYSIFILDMIIVLLFSFKVNYLISHIYSSANTFSLFE